MAIGIAILILQRFFRLSLCLSPTVYCESYKRTDFLTQAEPDTERVQDLADISRSAPCCHSNETRAPIANLPNSAQLEGIIPPT